MKKCSREQNTTKRLIKVLSLLLIPLFFIIVFERVSYNILERQAKLDLHYVEKCIQHHNPRGKQTIPIMEECAKNVKNMSADGDMFLYEPISKRIEWDASQDCSLSPEKSFLKEDGVCSLFEKPDSCKYGALIMSSQTSGNFHWYFDSNKEYIFFRTITIDNKQYRLAIGGKTYAIWQLSVPIILFFIFFWIFSLIGVV